MLRNFQCRRLALVLLAATVSMLGGVGELQASAVVEIDEGIFTLEAGCLNGGAGDTLVGTVTAQIVFIFNDNAAGGGLFQLRFNTHGDLVSQTTGEVFHLNETFAFNSVELPGQHSLVTLNDHLLLVGSGDGRVFNAPLTIHITENANGEITAAFALGQFQCE